MFTDYRIQVKLKLNKMDTIEIKDKPFTAPLFPIVGIASSADDLDALQSVLSKVPEDSGMAFLIIENLSLPQTNDLAEKIKNFARIPVHEIVNAIDLYPNNIYVIPQNNFVELEYEKLVLKPVNRSNKTANCLDIFFNSISQRYQSYAVGLLLNWSVADGAAGLKNLKELGGATVSAITNTAFTLNKASSEFIDYFTAPTETISVLQQIKSSYLVNHIFRDEEISADEEYIYKEIIELMVLKTGTNFHNYKQWTIRRRIAKRMVITKQQTTEQYLNLLKNNEGEKDLLFNDVLISVTYFFREQLFFDNLSKAVFPSLIETLAGSEFRIWSAGCSTGEEVYSLGICIDEFLESINRRDITVKIFASDLSEKYIEKARSGIYAAQDLKNINPERLAKYFIKKENGYHISKNIRDNCVFAVHDLTKDFPFSKIDFICCRNVLIYFNVELQNHVLASFHYALREKGILFLGKSETAFNAGKLFDLIEKQEKIYIRRNIPVRFAVENNINSGNFKKTALETISSIPAAADYRKIATDILLGQYSPAAVLIQDDFEIVHFQGDTSPFLQPGAGKPSFNIIDMVPYELRFSLRNAILKARNEKKNFEKADIEVKNQSFLTSFEVVYLPSHSALLMVIFNRKTIPSSTGENMEKNAAQKLHLLQEDFKQLNQEQQIYFEELKTSNEDLLLRAGELQFLNEQLETSTEELLSSNRELSFTNEELTNSRRELASMRNFYESIVNTVREPLIIIDQTFKVHSANPAFYSFFRTDEEHTEGFSILEIGNAQWNIPEIKESVLKKISRNETVENVKLNFKFSDGRKKIILFNASRIIDSVPEGLTLIALNDITDLELSNESLRAKNAKLLEQSRHLEHFTSEAGHNLLEPIRKIYMFGKKIVDNETGLSEAGKHNASRLLSSAVNMNFLIEDLINYSKINFSEKKFQKTDLNALLKKTISELIPLTKERSAVIDMDTLPSINTISWQIRLLFKHLISNAVKYTGPNNQPKIKIEMHFPEPAELSNYMADASQNFIKISVIDNGVGFEKDFEKLIFNPFYKLQSNDNNYGSGLGLTLVDKIVSNHNGFVKVSSVPGAGTTIDIYLPAEASLRDKYSAN